MSVCVSTGFGGTAGPALSPGHPVEPTVLGPPASGIWLANTGDYQAHGSIYTNKKYLGEKNFTLMTHLIRFNLPAFLVLFIYLLWKKIKIHFGCDRVL